MYGRDWNKIHEHVGSRSAAQLRSHAQKYFAKLQREGTGDLIPPPQPRTHRSSSPPGASAAESHSAAKPSGSSDFSWQPVPQWPSMSSFSHTCWQLPASLPQGGGQAAPIAPEEVPDAKKSTNWVWMPMRTDPQPGLFEPY